MLLSTMSALVGISALVLWHSLQSPPSLSEICALAREQKYDQAQELMTRYLRAFPTDHRAHLLMAQFAMDRPDPQPQFALQQLRYIDSGTTKERAVTWFSKGKAHYQAKRYDLAEDCWEQALALDPAVPEAGWALLDLLDFEGRVEEVHRLGMRLYETEPDPQDRVHLLLEMSRIDMDKVAPGSQVQVFKPVWMEHSENLALALVVGLALVHDSQPEEGLRVLRDALARHPGALDAWDGWLTGLEDGFQPEQLRQEFGRIPGRLATNPRFAKHEGAVARGLGDWPRAIASYRRAYSHEPFNGQVLYRLQMALRVTGDRAEWSKVNERLTAYQNAFKQMRGVYTEALGIRTLGLEPHPHLYAKLAELREQLGRFDEAKAWHRLILEDDPGNALSLAALARLK
jgi:tetratricopeptide (TPR) repeat protein